MSNKKAFVLGMLTVFGINATVNLISDIAYQRTIKKLGNNEMIIVSSIAKSKKADENKNEKEGS